MNDEQRLRNLVDRGCDRAGWESKHTRSGIRSSGRSLMFHFGGFDAMCLAEPERLQEWVDAKVGNTWTAYQNSLHAIHIYDFLIEEGVIGANPATSVKVPVPSRDDTCRKPPMDLKDVRKLFGYAKRHSFTLEGAKSYLVLCLKVRCGVQYASMAKCRRSDLVLSDGCGTLLASVWRKRSQRQVIYPVDEVTAWAFENYFKLRGPVDDGDPLIAKHGYHGTEVGGFYRDSVLQQRVNVLCRQCGLRLGEYDISKTTVMLAYAEGADILQATAVAAKESLVLAARVAEELGSVDPADIKRRLLGEIDSEEVVASGLMRSEDIMGAVSVAYRVPSLKVVIDADGWAKFELPSVG